MKVKFSKVWILLTILLFLILFSSIIISDSSPFETPKTCSQMWGGISNTTYCSLTLNDAFPPCNGTQSGTFAYVKEVYISNSSVFFGDSINITCEFQQTSGQSNYEYIWYNNDSSSNANWIKIWNISNSSTGPFNRSVVFVPNSTEGTQIVRCIISRADSTHNGITSEECANSTSSNSTSYDNDDVNFTVTPHLTYSFWNLTNFTTGTNISNSQNFTRLDVINVSAHWNKAIYNAWVQHDGNGSSINYSVSSPSNWTNYTLNFSNETEFSRTGNITISSIYANDTTSATNNTPPSLFFYLWGFSKVAQVTSNQTTLYNSTPAMTICKVIDNITSQGVNNSNVSFYGSDNFLNWSLTNSTGYANLSFVVNATSLPSNYSVKCNITDQPSLYYNASSQSSNSTNVSVLSPSNIQVGNVWFNYSGITTNKTNLFTNLTIYANVTDDWWVSTVIANLSYPSIIIVNLSMSGDNTSSGWHLWNYTFNNSQYPLNSTGNYTVRIIANNSNGISNASNFLNFTVYSNYTLNLTSNYSVFNRGENVTIQALDINNITADSINWTANVTKINQTYNFIPQQTTFNYTILSNDSEGNYSIIANASKDNNTGNSTYQFNVSRNLTLIISSSPSSTPSKSSVVSVSASLYNARNELYNSSVTANITCDSGSSWNPINFSSGQATYSCIAPGAYSTLFNIDINVTDSYNNTGENSTTLTTEAQQVISTGGGGGGGGSVPSTVKKCSDNTTYDTCNAKRRPYYCLNGTLIQNCGTCGCIDSSYSCQPDGSCILVREGDFNFTLSSERIEIEQGGDGEVKGLLTNTGNKKLNLLTFVNVSDDCCNVSIPQNITLDLGENTFSIPIHVPIFTNAGTYDIKIGIGTTNVKKEKIITADVIESHYYNDLSEINSSLNILERQVQDYNKAGINTGNLGNLIEQSKTLLASANSSISKDDVKVLASSLSEAASNARYVTTSLNNLIMKKFMSDYSWLIIVLIIFILSTLYLVPEVLMPLYKIDKEVRKLKSEEKDLVASRIETEKQYFMRKIDENTFSKIMITKQDRILRVRGMIKNQEESVKNILENRLKPKGIAMTLKQKITNIKVFKKKSEN